MQEEQMLPQAIEAEQAVLGGIMLNPEQIQSLGRLQIEHFYMPANRLIFAAMLELDDKGYPVDALTLKDYLEQRKQLERAGGENYLGELISAIPTAAHNGHYANIVSDRFISRKLIDECRKIEKAIIENESSVIEQLDFAETRILSVADKVERNEVSNEMADVMDSTMVGIQERHIDSGDTGITTGIKSLDVIVDASPGDLIILAGRPSMGKTALGLNILRDNAKNGKRGAIFTLEMPASQIAERLVASEAKINARKLRKKRLDANEWARFAAVHNGIESLPIFIDDTPGIGVRHISATARRIKKKHGGLDMILIDYLQLMGSDVKGKTEAQELAHITTSLKNLAKELAIPIILLSQLNRSLESRDDKRPIASDLRGSGSIEQDADVIMFAYREFVYSHKKEDEEKVEIIVNKFRAGGPGEVNLRFQGKYVLFSDLSQDKEVLKKAA